MLDPLKEMLVTDKKFGFVIIDGSGTLWATLQGNSKEILQEISVMLPKKHGRGGQSAPRFGRIRLEKRLAYLKKIAEMTTKHFIGADNRLNVEGIILGGSANFKSDLEKGELLDERIQKGVISIVDVSYGGENGLNEAIWLSSGILTNVKFMHEKKLLSDFYAEIAQGTDMVVFGPRDTMAALELGAIDKLVVFEELTTKRVVVEHPASHETKILYLSQEQLDDPTKKHITDEHGIVLEVKD